MTSRRFGMDDFFPLGEEYDNSELPKRKTRTFMTETAQTVSKVTTKPLDVANSKALNETTQERLPNNALVLCDISVTRFVIA